LQKSYLGLQNSYDDDPYIVEKLIKSSTSFVYNCFPDSVFNLAENGKYQICPDFGNRTETSNCKYYISGSTYPNEFQLIPLESLATFLQLFYRSLFQIL